MCSWKLFYILSKEDKMAPRKKKFVNKEEFDEYGFRRLGDEDEDDNVIVDPKSGASAGCRASNSANKSLCSAEQAIKKEEIKLLKK